MNKEKFILECLNLGIEINENLYDLFYLYYKELVKWNEKFNLTSILKEEDVFLKHFYDCITIFKTNLIDEKINLCDFGSGAGFPGMVIAILRQDVKVTLLESNNKKCEFLKHIVNTLSLNNVDVICERAEDYSKNNREFFDIVTCRAVSSLPVISEIAGALVKNDGYMIFLKSSYDLEYERSKELLKKLGFEIKNVINFILPDNVSERNILIFKKINITPLIYPRSYNVIIKNK